MAATDAATPTVALGRPQRHTSATTVAYGILLTIVSMDTFGTSLVRITINAGMPPFVIAGLRLTLAWLILTPFVLRRYGDDLRRMSRRDILLTIGAGVGLVSHLMLAFLAVDNAPIMVANVVFSTSLLWGAGMERVFLKVYVHRLVLVGVLLAFAGSIIIGLSAGRSDAEGETGSETSIVVETNTGGRSNTSIKGTVLALVAAVAGAVYLIFGRKARENLATVPYIWGLYGSGAVVGMAAIALSGEPLAGYSREAYLWLAVLLVVVQFGIHGGANYVLRYISVTIFSLIAQIAVVTGAVAAYFLFDEVPRPVEVLGGAVILSGVLVAIWGQRSRRKWPVRPS